MYRKIVPLIVSLICIFSTGIALLCSSVQAGRVGEPFAIGKTFSESANRSRRYVPGEIIVKFKETATTSQISSVNALQQASVAYTSPHAGFKIIKIPSDATVEQMVSRYRENPLVEYAEPNYLVHALWEPDDEYYDQQWHFPLIDVPEAWNVEPGGDEDVVVAVLDTGAAYEDYDVYRQAPDLAGTSFVYEEDFIQDDSHPNDDHGHGTHVTGTIAQTTNNGIGVAGIAFGCSIMPVKVLNKDGWGNYATIAEGIHYAVDNGADIINLSLGGNNDGDTLHDAVQYADNHGVVLVAAAGNNGSSPLYYPAAYEECIAVGAVRYDKSRASYSSYGEGMELVAPGGEEKGVLQQTFKEDPPVTDYTDFDYKFMAGTSMAAAHVTGVVALMLSQGISGVNNIRGILHTTAEDLGEPGWDTEYGYGLINAAGALSPDLTITDITSSPNPSLSGEQIQIKIEFANQGKATEEDFRIDVYTDSSIKPGVGQTGDMSILVSGASASSTGVRTFTCTYTTGGEKRIWARIDTDERITEAREENNLCGPYPHEVIAAASPEGKFDIYLTRNPFLKREKTHFVFTLPEEGRVSLKIYDAAGNLVRTLLREQLCSAGSSVATWEGENDFGRFVGSGIYIYRFQVRYSSGGSDKEVDTVGVVK